MAEGKGRPEWQSVQRKKQIVGVVKALLWAVIVGVFVGIGFVYRTQLGAFWNKLTGPSQVATTDQPAPKPLPPAIPKTADKLVEPPPPIAKKEEKKTDIKPLAVKPPESVPSGEESLVEKHIKTGRELMAEFEFAKAREQFSLATQKKGGPKLRDEAQAWLKKCDQFEMATKHIRPTDYATAETTYIIKTHDGWERAGMIRSQNEQRIELQEIMKDNPASTGSMKLPIPRNEIAQTIEVSRQQRREEFLKLLGSLESTINVQKSTDYYDMVYLAKRLALGRECMEYLNRAFTGGTGHEPDPYIGDSFRKEVIRRSIDRASLMLASGRNKTFVEAELKNLLKTLPGYEVASDEVEAFRIQVMSKVADNFKSTIKEVRKSAPAVVKTTTTQKAPAAPAPTAKELAREDNEPGDFVVDSGGVQGRGAAGPLVTKANARYEEGMKLYRGFKLGTNGNNNEILRSALACLSEAVDLYGEALDKDPGNKAVSDRQTEANMIVYACKKYQTL